MPKPIDIEVQSGSAGVDPGPKWTPGPWRYQEKSDAYTHIVRGPNGRFMIQFSQDPRGESEANARLTAAAPELYAACVALQMEAAARGCGLRIADEAIAKALGQSALDQPQSPVAPATAVRDQEGS